MSISKIILLYLLTTLVFFAIDMLWLGLIAKKLYSNLLGNFLTDEVNWTAAIIFYLLFIIGILIFAVFPSLEKNSLQQAIILGALFGFFTYATYDLTNLATLKNWPLKIVFIDIIWGMILTGTVSFCSFKIAKFIQ